MEEKMILNESVTEDNKEGTSKEVILENLPKVQPRKKNSFKEKECKVIAYDKYAKTLDVKFDKYGIRFKDVENFSGNIAIVKY